ncbi:MAG: hypothetical protein CVT49_00235 [candidate division Zixibacteria bacterium HGW-Zixibacteria-1]|nr:MAG: hypothetical protein CVT49_00235 [candidate division Zixibacteria bacterium HGW-Zixibacteria-1]
MNKRLEMTVLMLVLLLLSVAPAFGQSYVLTNGEPVGGGGRSTSTGYILYGSVPLTGCTPSTSTGYAVVGGAIGISYALKPTAVLEISHTLTSPRTVNFGTEQSISITIVAGDGADTSGTLYSRPFGQNSFTTRDMAKTANVMSFTILGTELGIRGMEYYVRIVVGTDTAWVGRLTAPYVFVTNMTNAQAQRPVAMPEASYRIIGVPIAVSNHSVATVFDDDLGTYDTKQWRLAGYDAAADPVYEEHTAAEQVYPGAGYWLIARGGKTYGSAGTCVRPNFEYGGQQYYRVPLDQGWNLLANPFAFNIAWGDVLFDDNGTIKGHAVDVLDDVIYSYTGRAYDTVSGIRAWEGVFVNIKKTGVEALIRCSEGAVGKVVPGREAPVAMNNWTVNMMLEVSGLADELNAIGVRPDASVGQDIHDYLEPPPAPDGPRLAFKLNNADVLPRRTDFRPPFDDGAVWNITLERAAGGIITFSGIENIPEGMSAMLRIGSRMTALIDGQTAITVPDGVSTAQLVIGTEKYISGIDGTVLPERFTLEQNVPNPFNPITNIHFTLPKPGHVKLEVFNILGQSVTVLNNEELPAGYHTAVWDGSDHSGTTVASGIYFYRIEYDNKDLTRKMLLLK